MNIQGFMDEVNPTDQKSLADWIRVLRDIYEEEPNEERITNRGLAMIMLSKKGDNYDIAKAAYVPEVPSLEIVLSMLGSLYQSDEHHDAALVAVDAWGLPLHLRDQQASESVSAHKRLMAGELTPEENKAAIRAFRKKWGKPSDYPESERTEVATYVAAASDGGFVGAEQLRGKEHELFWYGSAESPEPDNLPLTDRLSNSLRVIVERKPVDKDE